MREISKEEMVLVSGGFLPALYAAWAVVSPYVIRAALGAGFYATKKYLNGEEITGNGLMISASFGSVGGVGASLGKATGSTVGQVLWQANTVPITMAGQAIAAEY
ncbi:MAG: hypothetical protein V4490_07175 [Pseudomonadota bacterium]